MHSAVLGVCLWFAALSWASANPANIVIGLLLPPDELDSSSIRQAVELAVAHANQTSAMPARMVLGGRAGQWGTDGDEAVRLVSELGAQALIVPPGSAPSHLALQVAGRTAIPVVSLSADSSVTGTGVPWMLTMAPGTRAEARFLLTNTQIAAGGKWIALVPEGRAGLEVRRDLERAAEETGAKIQQMISVSASQTNLPNLITATALPEAAGILLWLDPGTAGHTALALRQAGFNGLLAGPRRLNSPRFIESAGSAAEGVLVPAISQDATGRELGRWFERSYHERFHASADMTACFAYDAAKLVIDLLRNSGGAPAYRAFPVKGTRPGVSGPLTFAEDGHRVATLELLICKKGGFGPKRQ